MPDSVSPNTVVATCRLSSSQDTSSKAHGLTPVTQSVAGSGSKMLLPGRLGDRGGAGRRSTDRTPSRLSRAGAER
jgi:hypothetical protein